ncbi:hypothetical protein GW932_00630 [archaeon]|nr:hypothetical protein [archaeon]
MSKLQEIFEKGNNLSVYDKYTFSKMFENSQKRNVPILNKISSREDKLKAIVERDTPRYFFENFPSNNYNIKSMKANYLLALMKARENSNDEAQKYLRESIWQFKQMAKHKLSLGKYIEKNTFSLDIKPEKEINHYKRKLSQIAKEVGIGLETMIDLSSIASSNFPRKNLEKFYFGKLH